MKLGDLSKGTDPTMPLWRYSTVSLSLEIKKILPPAGVDWLFLRARVKMIEKVRMNADIVILDERQEMVAFSNQVNSITPGLGFTKKISKL